MGKGLPDKFDWKRYGNPDQGLDKLNPIELRRVAVRLIKELSRQSELFGIKPFGRKRIPERDDIIRLLVVYERILVRNAYFVSEKQFRKWNWEPAEELLAQYSYEEMRQFLEWFFLMKPTHKYWRTAGNVDRLVHIRSAVNEWVGVETSQRPVGGVDYDRR